MSSPRIPDHFFGSDALGRGVFSQRRAERAANTGQVAFDLFLERRRIYSLSVDRLDFVPDSEIAVIGDEIAAMRDKEFFGWAEISVDNARKRGRSVASDPLPGNSYHAHIHLNIVEGDEARDEQTQHAVNLANAAAWRPRPVD